MLLLLSVRPSSAILSAKRKVSRDIIAANKNYLGTHTFLIVMSIEILYFVSDVPSMNIFMRYIFFKLNVHVSFWVRPSSQSVIQKQT